MAVLSGDATANRARARELHRTAQQFVQVEPSQALALLEEAIATDPDYLPAYEAAVPLWIAAGKITAMVSYMERATARHDDFAAGWYALGYAYRNQGRHKIAVYAYRSYLSLRPTDPSPWFGYAMSLKETGQRADARGALLRYLALERDPAMNAFVDQARRELEALADPFDPWVAVAELCRVRGLPRCVDYARGRAGHIE